LSIQCKAKALKCDECANNPSVLRILDITDWELKASIVNKTTGPERKLHREYIRISYNASGGIRVVTYYNVTLQEKEGDRSSKSLEQVFFKLKNQIIPFDVFERASHLGDVSVANLRIHSLV
jgi:hypothetical protein